MSVSYISSITDVPGVQTAISHLQDLQANMRAAQGFQPGDITHIDVIIQCIQDLEQERLRAHEALETETIKASVLRHKLLYYPDEIKNEISEAVAAARKDNEDELASLNKELSEINDEIAYSSQKLKEMDEKNAILRPERNRVKQENEEIIAELNEQLSEKAGKQICLNDTRDKLRETKQKIVELDEGLVILKEDLIQERTNHRIEKTRLKGVTEETTEKTKDQKHTNSVRKLELTNLRDQHSQLSAEFSGLKDETIQIELTVQDLKREEEELKKMLDEQLVANEKLRKKGVELEAHGVQMDKDFETRKKQALRKIEKLNRDIDREKERGELLESNRKDAEEQYEHANDIRKTYEEKVNELKDRLQKAQDTYKARVEDIGRLTQENQEMELRLVELAEEHELLVRNLNSEIEDERAKLATKRKERMELQAEREESQKVLTDFRGEQQKYLREMNKLISGLRNEHDQLSEEGRDLRKIIRQDDKDISSTTKELDKANEEFNAMKTSMGMMIERLEASVVKLQAEQEEKQRVLDEKIPVFEALEKEHNVVAENFDRVKKSIIALKNKKNGLDDSVKRTLRDIEKLSIPAKATEDDLRKHRQAALDQFKTHAEARNQTERELYSVGVKLRTVLEENDRFQTAVNDLEKKKERFLKNLEEMALKKDQLLRELEQEKEELLTAWLRDQDMTEAQAVEDQEVVDQFSDLVSRTQERQELIEEVSGNLWEELGKLDGFLKMASSQRPKEATTKGSKTVSRQASSDTTQTARPHSQGSQRSTQLPPTGTRNTSRVQSRVPSRPPSSKTDTIEDKF